MFPRRLQSLKKATKELRARNCPGQCILRSPGQGYRPWVMDCTIYTKTLHFFINLNPRYSPLWDPFSCNHLMQAVPRLTGAAASGNFFWTKLPITISSSKLGSPGGCRGAVSATRNPDLACLTKLHFDCVQPPYTWLGAIIWHYYFLLQLKRHFVQIHAPVVIWISSRCSLIFKSGI